MVQRDLIQLNEADWFFHSSMTLDLNELPQSLTGYSDNLVPKLQSENLICCFGFETIVIFDIEKEKLIFQSKITDKRYNLHEFSNTLRENKGT